ncbi:Hypothetical predicted protein [Mytilus galloprovincialis]|uniref:C1q domain-containing protein n=1 Tax=Mytilus galloprovincialis TaxID=29158 RepID=A0A8B6FUI8_MYTGA|nr:Hypothetical predicted protein [Mytilus galloprovincialis]
MFVVALMVLYVYVNERRMRTISSKVNHDRTEQNIIQINDELHRRGTEINLMKEELKSTITELTQVKVDLKSTENKLNEMELDLESTKTELKLDLESTKNELTLVKVDFESTINEFKQVKVDLESTKIELKQVKVDLESTKNDLKQVKVDLKSTKNELQQVYVDLESTRNALEQIKVELVSTREQINILRKEMMEKDNVHRKETDQIRADVNALRKEIKKIKKAACATGKPAFFAALTPHFPLPRIDDVIKFDDVRVNRGGAYDPSTGVFTATVQGLFNFTCSILSNHGSTCHYQLNKNAQPYVLGYSHQGADASPISSIIELKVGDRVFIKHRVTASEVVFGAAHTSFSGYFIHE